MFSHIRLPATPPSTLEEAIASATDLLDSAGLETFSVKPLNPAQSPSTLIGGAMEVKTPLKSLEALLHKSAVQAAAEHGVNVVSTTLETQQAGNNRLNIRLLVESKIFGSTVKMGLSGFAEIQNETQLVFSNFETEGGSGMFGGIANAFIKPKLAALESCPLDLQKIAGMAITVPNLRCKQDVLHLTLAFC